ncbi:MAG TPA: GGDEF domain-containing protein [Amycolatopsis sp.]|uniref:GGDEF domain-containing protein n=1 Tax=Amycolatopsis sp. TaxID=37632 RepID=UPI002B4922FB|nr:GGDEF domain-containing protein [Amycolatopsis sp.]HKS47880.1 GGDEF domain-containing protein [Amycolatopsis sp.]
MSDAWLVGRARELLAAVQHTNPADQREIVRGLDDMLAETQRRGEPVLVAQLLRAAVVARLVIPGFAAESEPLLDEMLAHSRRHGLGLYRADAHALRGRLLILAEQEDAALTEIARALAILDDSATPDIQMGRREWAKMQAAALIDCWIVLNQLGVYEAAEEVIARAHQANRESAGPHDITVQLINRVKMLAGWGLRLERVDRHAEAEAKFRTAASMAVAVEAPFAESLFPRKGGVPAVDQVGVLAAALALASPDASQVERLQRLVIEPSFPHEQVIMAIALARCLDAAGQREDALKALHTTRITLAETNSEPSMRLNLVRELARLDHDSTDESIRSLREYTRALEAELWSMRESQIATLDTRREHERLSAQHGAISQQALQDPLTGLPNRRALDEHLRSLSAMSTAQPLAVALIDLDRFKGVNDEHSHAEGDDVLRVVASTVRDALRGDDIVARYGGDEFVALLPGAPVSAAKQALGRAVSAVASLPLHLSHGVTLSVGLVSLRPQERADQVLSRADAAMYQAKRRGGNQVATMSSAPPESFGVPPGDDPAPDAGAHP